MSSAEANLNALASDFDPSYLRGTKLGRYELLAAIGNWSDIGTKLRWPYRSIPMDEASRLRTMAREALPELFD